MRRGFHPLGVTLAITACLAALPIVVAAEAEPESNPLAGFDRFVGGRWYFGETYQTFEWGVGKRVLRATAHFPSPDGPKLGSEGFWYLHPESGEIRGTFVSIEEGLDLFEYVTSFDADTVKSRVSIHGPKGRGEYFETLRFTDADHYVWSLWRETAEGREQIVKHEYERRPAPAAAKEDR